VVTCVEMDRKQEDLSRPCSRQAEVGRQGGREGGREAGRTAQVAHLQVAVLTSCVQTRHIRMCLRIKKT